MPLLCFNPLQVGYSRSLPGGKRMYDIGFNPLQVGYSRYYFTPLDQGNKGFNPLQVGYSRLTFSLLQTGHIGFNPLQVGYSLEVHVKCEYTNQTSFNPLQVGYSHFIKKGVVIPRGSVFQSLIGRLLTLQCATSDTHLFYLVSIPYRQATHMHTCLHSLRMRLRSFNPLQVGYSRFHNHRLFNPKKCFNPLQVGYSLTRLTHSLHVYPGFNPLQVGYSH